MFDRLKSLNVSADATAVFVFDRLEGAPSLRVRPTSEQNRPYLNAVLSEGKRLARRRKLSAALLAETRARDLELFPKHVVVGWEKPALLDDGSPASNEHVAAFLEAIPPDMFDELRGFCGDLDSFRPGSDPDDLVGNS
jgi:hypothetical protein